MFAPAATGSGAPAFEMLRTGAELTVVASAAPSAGGVSFESIWWLLLVMVVPFGSGVLTLTTRVTVPDAPAARLPRVHVTMPPAGAPGAEADTNVVFAGSGSLITTPVAFSFPLFE